jgi:hypothetical protein
MASLCLQVPRGNAIGLGIFDGDNLETRIMMLTEKRTSLSRAGLIGLASATSFLFGSSTVLARAVSLQEASASTNTAQMFAGTWHWMFHGQSFATMILVQNGSGITGSVTPSRIALDDDGELNRADPLRQQRAVTDQQDEAGGQCATRHGWGWEPALRVHCDPEGHYTCGDTSDRCPAKYEANTG